MYVHHHCCCFLSQRLRFGPQGSFWLQARLPCCQARTEEANNLQMLACIKAWQLVMSLPILPHSPIIFHLSSTHHYSRQSFYHLRNLETIFKANTMLIPLIYLPYLVTVWETCKKRNYKECLHLQADKCKLMTENLTYRVLFLFFVIRQQLLKLRNTYLEFPTFVLQINLKYDCIS